MSSKGNHFVLYMFQQDLENMKQWVLQYPNNETGGDLFGLWSGEGDNAVIHVVLGPGQGCTHGDYHFYQDVNYLEKVGKLLTENYMLGHIGEWHSHHQLKLDRPSDGDCSTIRRNFPQGSCGFFLMIANIICKGKVSFSPYIFKAGSRRGKAGEVQVICEKSPFSLVGDISEALHNGKENYQVENVIRQDKVKLEKAKKSRFMSIIDSLGFLSDNQENRKSLSVERKQSTSKNVHRTDEVCDHTRSETMNESKVASSLQEVSECVFHYQWYTKDSGQAILKHILNELVADITDSVNMQWEEDSIQNMRMTFQHCNSTIQIIFPFNFPVLQAKIKLDNSLEGTIYYSCNDVNRFHCKQFVTEIRKMLKKAKEMYQAPQTSL